MAWIIVDEDQCIGSGECIALAPDVMELNDHGTAQVKVSEIDDDLARRICDACPVSALSLDE
jgi:ferredoxin